jgi:hypothetical protein
MFFLSHSRQRPYGNCSTQLEVKTFMASFEGMTIGALAARTGLSVSAI